MYKLTLSFLFVMMFNLPSYAQEKSSGDSSKLVTEQMTDSARMMLDSAIALIKELGNEKESYAQVGVGVGNSLFSVHNNALNAKQGASTFVFTPSVGYYHKSGFSLSAISYLLKEKKAFGINQYAVTPAYETPEGKDIDFLASYTHYFVKNEYSNYSSPIQNDFYASVIYKKPLIQPGLALGYSFGEYKDVRKLDTTIASVEKHYYDSATNKINTVSAIVSVQHEFDWDDVFKKNDAIIFTPALMLNLGKDNATSDANTNIGLDSSLNTPARKALGNRLNKLLTKRAAKLQTTPFQVESAGLDLAAQYAIGIFSVEPHAYFDYYIPSSNNTTSNRFTQVYSINFYFSIY